MRYLFFLSFLFFFISCQNKKENTKAEATELVMYQPSEMAALMNTMYYMNLDTKKKILNNENIGSFPERFLTIHTATLTDTKDRTDDFLSFSNEYINNMKSFYQSDLENRKNNFNKAIRSCIACHQTSCRGPIPRIKKLLIQ